MRVAVLGSGSRGNSMVVESGGRRLLLDAGFSCRQISRRLEGLGLELRHLEGLLLTHEHGDHVRGAELLMRKHRLPAYATQGTWDGTELSEEAGAQRNTIRSGRPFEVAGFHVEAFQIPHDAREPVGFLIEDSEGHRLGLVADLGMRTQLAWGRLRDLDALVIETNHDLQMLRVGPYPWHLKQRVAGRHGHLSNREAAEGVRDLLSERLQWVALYHLSQTNNLPALAAQEVTEQLDREGSQAQVVVTRQNEATSWLDIEAAGIKDPAGESRANGET